MNTNGLSARKGKAKAMPACPQLSALRKVLSTMAPATGQDSTHAKMSAMTEGSKGYCGDGTTTACIALSSNMESPPKIVTDRRAPTTNAMVG